MKTQLDDVLLRPVTAADKRRIFEWRNTPFLIKWGGSGRAVTWEEHCKWFDGMLHSKDTRLVIVCQKDNPIGQIRFDPAEQGLYMVSIYLVEESVGRGIGTNALKKAMDQFRDIEADAGFLALVRTDNVASISMFSKLGYQMFPGYEGLPENHLAMRSRPSGIPA